MPVASLIPFPQISDSLINSLEGLGKDGHLASHNRDGLFGHFIHCTFFHPHVYPPLDVYLISLIAETFWGSVTDAACFLLEVVQISAPKSQGT